MKESLVSVIIPVYNSEEYLDQCLTSVIKQTYKNIEIILIDDGSSDRSLEIIEGHAKADARVKILRKKNGGVASARNCGVKHSSGKYIAFVDSDDFLDDNYISHMIKVAEKDRVDVVQCNYRIAFGKQIKKPDQVERKKEFTKDESVKSMLYQAEISSALWGKIIKRELFEGVSFPEGKVHEDLYALYYVLKKTEKTIILGEYLYNYRLRQNSLIHASFSKHTLDILDVLESISADVERHSEYKQAFMSRKVNADFFVLRQLPSEYKNLKKELWSDVKRLRARVLKDPMVRKKTKVGLVISYFGLPAVKIVYRMFVGKYDARRVQ